MIKINKISKQNKKIFIEDVQKRYLELLEKIQTDTKYERLICYLKDENGTISVAKVNNILTGNVEALKNVISNVGEIQESDDENFHRLYRNFSSRPLAREWGERIGVNVCPYCNRNFVFTLKNKNRPQYDHFFPKSRYPYLSVSMYNLVPCCQTCNSLKSANDPFVKSIVYPFEEEFGYNIYFEINTEDIYTYIGLSDDFEILIGYNEDLVDISMVEKVKSSDEIFNLKNLYNKHKDYAKKILKNKYIYTDEYCESLIKSYPLLFTNIDELKNTIYLNSLEKDKWGDQVLAKFTYDLLQMED